MKGINILIGAATLLYVISPIDLLPFNPIDDLIVSFGGLVLTRLLGGND